MFLDGADPEVTRTTKKVAYFSTVRVSTDVLHLFSRTDLRAEVADFFANLKMFLVYLGITSRSVVIYLERIILLSRCSREDYSPFQVLTLLWNTLNHP